MEYEEAMRIDQAQREYRAILDAVCREIMWAETIGFRGMTIYANGQIERQYAPEVQQIREQLEQVLKSEYQRIMMKYHLPTQIG